MLTPDERDRLIDAIAMTAEVMGQEISVNMLTQMADDLAEYSEGQLALALRACRHEIKGKLTLKDIVDRIDDGRPPREEAWSIALASLDEEDTVAWTEEITSAITACEALMHSRDKVAARMAFLQAYDRLVMESRRLKRPARWSLSIGCNVDRRRVAIEQAGLLRRLTASRVADYSRLALPAPITGDGQAIAGLLAGPVRQPDSAEVRKRLGEIRKQLRQGNGDASFDDRLEAHQRLVESAASEAIAESLGPGHTGDG